MRETFEQQTGQLGRETCRRRVFQTIALDIADTGFGGVGEHEADIRVAGQRQIFIKLMVDINFTVNRTDDAGITHRFTLFVQTADDGRIQTILSAQ